MQTLTYKSEYRAFHDAKARCNNANHKRYMDWGGRGIEFKFTCFEQFLSHIGTKPAPCYQLDRINNDGNYEIGNVKWSTRSAQQRNKRVSKHNVFGVTGVRRVSSRGLITPTYQAYCKENGKFKQLYTGPSFELAVESRKTWEQYDRNY